MGYKNGSMIFPAELLKQIQNYVDGESVYIPRVNEQRKKQENTALAARNLEIYRKYKSGVTVRQLSEAYYISPQGIYKILSKYKI